MNWSGVEDTSFDFKLEETPKMHKETEGLSETPAPGWYANCYLCGRSFEERYMLRKEYQRKTVIGTGWSAQTETHRYVISYCVWCHHSHLEK